MSAIREKIETVYSAAAFAERDLGREAVEMIENKDAEDRREKRPANDKRPRATLKA